MKTKIFSLILVGLLIQPQLHAQESWTLRQCIDYALENNIQIKQASIRTESSKTALSQSKSSRLPNLNASLSDGFSFGRSQDRDGVYVDQNSNSANASLNTSVPLFEGLRIHNEIASKKFDFMAALEDHQKIKNDISLNVASLYLNVLIQKELLKVAQEQLALSENLEKRTESLVSSGKEAMSALYEMRAQKANDAYNLTNAEKNLKLALLDLSQILEIENGQWFDIQEPPIDDIADMPIPVVVFENAAVTLPDVKAEEYRLESSRKSLNIAKSSYYPSLSLSASTSTGYYYLQGSNIQNEAFGDQLSNNWRSYVGVSMSIPIFNRMSVRNSVSQSKIQIAQQETEVENARKTLFKDIQRAVLNANVSKDRYAAASLSVDANKEAYRYVEERYQAGRATAFDLQQTKNNLEKSQSDKIQAKYEFIFNTKILDFYNNQEIDL